ncbi:MAG: hypothetical protein H7A45_13525 [Verrucomicrobiales bacterium]|nr:hypothetical protein [Verrucomicrobiales bacterium]
MVAGRQRGRTAGSGDTNPYAYSVGVHEKTDPALVKYVERRRIDLPWKEARRLAVTPQGNLLVAAGQRLGEVTPDGSAVREVPMAAPLRCVAVAADGTIYAGFRAHLEVFEADGKRRATWEKSPERSWFTGIAVTDDAVFAADAGARVILRHDLAGQVTARIGERDKDRDIPGFVLPSPYLDVEWHPDGLLRVNNPGRHRVEFYTPDGALEFAWGRPTMAIEGFSGCCNPVNLAVLSDGRLVTCEKGLPRVKVYSAHGDFECVVAGTEMFPENAQAGAGDGFGDGTRASLDAVVGPEDRIYILDTVTAQIHVMERKPTANS